MAQIIQQSPEKKINWKLESHIQLWKRIKEAKKMMKDIEILNDGQSAFAPSRSDPTKGHSIILGNKPYCDCQGFQINYARDSHYKCTHILGAECKVLEMIKEESKTW